jgi:HD-GYP domain-containing protein (c-di-GMP phosphodiesterase class II)
MTSSVLEPLRQLTEIGIALSAEKDNERLLEQILESAKALTNADGGTLYLRTDDDRLRFAIMLTDSLDLRLGGTSGEAVTFAPLPLYDARGEPNRSMVAPYAAVMGRTVNIADAYQVAEFDFSGTRAFDENTGYRSKSFLTVPMRNHENDIIGVLQLINARDPETGAVGAFSEEDQQLVESLSSQAAVALTNKRLLDAQRRLFESFIELIAGAIDDKSPYTGGHCRRVPELTMMLADAAAATREGPLKDFEMDEENRYELKIAGWLHDCGKITTPEYVVDKSTKLETIFDRIQMVEARYEILKRDAHIRLLEGRLAAQGNGPDTDVARLERGYAEELRALEDERAFLQRCNIGGEEMSPECQDRVRRIAERRWRNGDGGESPALTDDEVYNLTIPKGTLTPEEREVIDHHIVATIRMLESLPYPQYLKNVPEYAVGHHEKMDGTGYPRGLTRQQMSVQARVMAIADIFEALTAKDRPYKDGMKLSEALRIMGRMKLANHIDPDLFDVFVHDKVYLRYAQAFLDPAQIDAVDASAIPGYVPPGQPL